MGQENLLNDKAKSLPTDAGSRTELVDPARQLRPLLTTALLKTWGDGFIAKPMVGKNQVLIRSYSIKDDLSYGDHINDQERHRKALEEGWGRIHVAFNADPGERDSEGRAVRNYNYLFVVPREFDTGHPYLAVILGVKDEEIFDILEKADTMGSPITTPQQLQERLFQDKRLTTRIDLDKPTVIVSTWFTDQKIEPQIEVLGERTEDNTSHYNRLQALYDELTAPQAETN